MDRVGSADQSEEYNGLNNTKSLSWEHVLSSISFDSLQFLSTVFIIPSVQLLPSLCYVYILVFYFLMLLQMKFSLI